MAKTERRLAQDVARLQKSKIDPKIIEGVKEIGDHATIPTPIEDQAALLHSAMAGRGATHSGAEIARSLGGGWVFGTPSGRSSIIFKKKQDLSRRRDG